MNTVFIFWLLTTRSILTCQSKLSPCGIKGKANKADILEKDCYRLPNQDEEMDEAFYEQLAEVMQSPWETSTYLIYVGNIIQCRGSSPGGF